MDLAVQVDAVGEAGECEHPEGEAAVCGDSILQYFHCAIIRVRTPRERERERQSISYALTSFTVTSFFFSPLLVKDQVPADVIVHLVDGCGPAVVKHKTDLIAVKLIHLHSYIELLVHF